MCWALPGSQTSKKNRGRHVEQHTPHLQHQVVDDKERVNEGNNDTYVVEAVIEDVHV